MGITFNPFTGTFDFTGTSGGGGGTIGGSIAATQVAFGSAANTIAGTNDLTWNSSATDGFVIGPLAGAGTASLGIASLTLVGSSSGPYPNFHIIGAGLTAAPAIVSARARGTPTVPTQVKAGDSLVDWSAYGWGTTLYKEAGSWDFFAAEDFTDTVHGTRFSVTLCNLGSMTLSETFSLTGNGDASVLFGNLYTGAPFTALSAALQAWIPAQLQSGARELIIDQSGNGAVFALLNAGGVANDIAGFAFKGSYAVPLATGVGNSLVYQFVGYNSFHATWGFGPSLSFRPTATWNTSEPATFGGPSRVLLQGYATEIHIVPTSGVWIAAFNSTFTNSLAVGVGDLQIDGNFFIGNGKAFRSDQTTAHTALIQAYDVDDTTYRTFGTLTNGNTPSFALAFPTGGTLTGNFSTLQVGGVNVLTTAVTNIATTSPITGGPITTTGTIALDVSVDFLFTHSQTITPGAAGQGGLTVTGNTETTSHPVWSATQTWNAGGVAFTAQKLNVTNTASAAGSLLLDLEIGGLSVFNVYKGGGITGSGDTPVFSMYGAGASAPAGGVQVYVGAYFGVMTLSSSATMGSGTNARLGPSDLTLASAGTMGFASSASAAIGTGSDVGFMRDAANTMALRNSNALTTAQIFNVYNTFTSTTSFERLMLDWATTANVAMIYTQKGSGGGTARVLQLNYGGTTTSALSIPITSGAMTFGADPTISGFGAVIYNTGTVSLTGQTADIADTAITINGTGLYSLSYYLLTTTADAAAGSVKLAIKYTDDSGAKEIDSNAVILTATTGFDAGGPITVRTNSGTVTYGTTHTGIYGTSAYALYISLEKLL